MTAGTPPQFRRLGGTATQSGGAARVGGLAILWAVLTLASCSSGPAPRAGVHVASAPAPSRDEAYCAWYGDARNGVLYFGQAAFWSAFRAAGDDPRADLRAAGPQLIGRFDLAAERFLPPLDVTTPGARSGVWDVHAHANRRVYFTTFYESMGAVDVASGAVTRFPDLGLGLNEIAPLPDGNLLVTRYGAAAIDGVDSGSLVVITPDGERVAEHAVEPPAGFTAAPKTPAWDARRREFWTTNDLIPHDPGPVRTDATVLGSDGVQLRRIAEPEVQFVASRPGGGLVRVEHAVDGLWLVSPDDAAQPRLLDADFVAALDFAQDLKFAAAGRSVTTRWSGWLHVAASDGSVRSLRLPALEEQGLYYTAVLHDERVCATYCGGVRVVCTDAP
ncbi:MAG: hypothetical protein JRH16_08255 [Deltaproteobacteria bacterium]|nr:hypothetical protein [Deltaproteobacteria bacterium]MBW2359950.1 hypothetical protein [Deltaproteobacteria bacterium]